MAEKKLVELARTQRELYEKGNAALQKKNFDYAITIYNQILLSEPGFYDCRAALRACQLEKAGNRGGFFKKMLGTASASPLLAKAQLQARNNPQEALGTCEQILNSDPNNVPAHKLLAEAALALGFHKTAVLSLQIAFKNSPRDLDLGMRLAEALTLTGQIDRAEAVYDDLQKLAPGDPTISQLLKNLHARRTMEEQGYQELESGAGSYRDILRDKEQAASLEKEQRQVKSDDVAAELIAEYQQRLAQEPNDRKLLRQIAELYAQKKEFGKALEYYGMITTIEGQGDASLERAIADTHLRRMDHEIAQLDPSADDYSERRAAIEKERQEFEIGEARKRVEKYPNDLAYRHELGVLYFKAGRIGEAIQEFQKSQLNPHKKISALYYLGLCFSRRNMHDLAARSLQNALAEKQVFDDEKKELLYALGSVLEKSGKPNEAIEHFKQIYEVDIGYKDVAAKVDAYYANAG